MSFHLRLSSEWRSLDNRGFLVVLVNTELLVDECLLDGITCRSGVAPPTWELGGGQVQGGNDNDGADCESGVETSRGDVIVSHPPASVTISDYFLEYKADKRPRQLRELVRQMSLLGYLHSSKGLLGEALPSLQRRSVLLYQYVYIRRNTPQKSLDPASTRDIVENGLKARLKLLRGSVALPPDISWNISLTGALKKRNFELGHILAPA